MLHNYHLVFIISLAVLCLDKMGNIAAGLSSCVVVLFIGNIWQVYLHLVHPSRIQEGSEIPHCLVVDCTLTIQYVYEMSASQWHSQEQAWRVQLLCLAPKFYALFLSYQSLLKQSGVSVILGYTIVSSTIHMIIVNVSHKL